MSDAPPIPDGPNESSTAPVAPGSRFLDDRLVRVMVYVATGLVILFLATVVGVLITGVASPTGPRSVAERELVIAASRAEGTIGDAQAPYINALIASGNLPAARVTLAQARASVSASTPVSDLDLAEARLESAGEDFDKAVTFADRAIKGYVAEAKSDKTGLPDDYYNALLVKAYALLKLGRTSDAVAEFDIYLAKNKTASDIFVDRGYAKIQLKDKAGAEKDFREALKYVPYDEEAKAGLKRIGVAR